MATTDELMMAYAAGATSPGLSLLCAAQLTLSPTHRPIVRELEAVGGALLSAEPDAGSERLTASADDLIDRADALGLEREDDACDQLGEAGPLPSPVMRAVGVAFDDISWRARLRGISEHVIWEDGREKVSLIRARPGSKVPGHTHRGPEATLVMAGVMRDGDAVLTAGDIALCGPEHDHHPEILGDELCYCLTVVDGGLRFTGPLGRALNLFAD